MIEYIKGEGRVLATIIAVLGTVALALLIGSRLLAAPSPPQAQVLLAASPTVPAVRTATLEATAVVTAVATIAPLIVYVSGAVEAPGVYALGPGARIMDAVSAAGGLRIDADVIGTNLAAHLSDAQHIHIPAQGEAAPTPAPAPVADLAPAAAAVAPEATSGGLVNINTADQALLETLPRIGPATAQRIIDHRTANGPFAAIDALQDVPGIGPATFAGLRDLITVGP